MIADLSKVQDAEVGDGTTSVAVLAGELLREAELLVNQRVHPMIIIAGFRRACEIAQEVLAERSFDNADDPGTLLPLPAFRLLAFCAQQLQTGWQLLLQMRNSICCGYSRVR